MLKYKNDMCSSVTPSGRLADSLSELIYAAHIFVLGKGNKRKFRPSGSEIMCFQIVYFPVPTGPAPAGEAVDFSTSNECDTALTGTRHCPEEA